MATAQPPPHQRVGSPEASAPTTDFDLIESQKENIRPLATGRSAATLGALYNKHSDEAERLISEGSERFQKEIAEAERRDREGEDMVDGIQDVLDPYHRYAMFIVQHSPTVSPHVLSLLETTTRRFISDARYAQDARYLKLWIMYARDVERREEVWAFLESRDIGTRHASFYEEWSMAAESLGRRKKADDVLRLGIARKAAPLERLKNRHAAFLARIMAPPSGIVPDDDPPMPAAGLRTPARSVLGQVAGGPGLSSVTGAAPAPAGASRISKGTNGSKIEVFIDNGSTNNPPTNEWDDFGTRDGRRKENVVEAIPWKGETLPQSAARNRVAPRTPKLEVFKDASDDSTGVRPAEEVLFGTNARQPASEAELLRLDPLKFYDTSAVTSDAPPIPKLPAPPSSARKPLPKKSKSTPAAGFVMQPWECPSGGAETRDSRGKVERRMFDWDAAFRGGEEWSFEEIRARQRGLLGKDWKELKDWERSWHKPGATTPRAEEKKKSLPSPTLNTKLANAEVMSLFNQTIHGGKVRDSDSEDTSEDEDDVDDVPQGVPTPLPAPRQVVSMLEPGSAMVPPTPTPSSGHAASLARLGAPPRTTNVFGDENVVTSIMSSSSVKLNIFIDENNENAVSDENAPPPSASRSRINVFSETPAKTPLGTRTPLAASSSKSRTISIFTEEDPSPADAALSKENVRFDSGNIFATPAPAVAERQWVTTATFEAISEESQDENYKEHEDELCQGGPRPMRRFHINEMTPITERTYDYTTNTTRSHRTSLISEFDGDDTGIVSQPHESLSSVKEEEERPSPRGKDRSVEYESASPSAGHIVARDYDRSGSVDTAAFGVTEGFTIARDEAHTGMSMNTIFVVDQTTTMHTAPDRSVTDEAFITAPQPNMSISDIPNPCNPADEDVIGALLQRIDPPLSKLPLVIDRREIQSGRLDKLQKAAKAKARRSSSSSRVTLAPVDDAYILEMSGNGFEIRDKLGEGGFGAVFLAVDNAARAQLLAREDDESEDEDDDNDMANKCLVAIKVEQPTSIWEAVVLSRVQCRVSPTLVTSIIRSRSLHAFADESFLLLDYSSQGTLLDVVNKATVWGISPGVSGGPSVPDELVAIFFTIELLKLVEGLHRADFIHGDLKIDNCLVRLDPVPASEGGNNSWSAQYNRTGDHGWSHKGVRLIDFGRAIDLSLFPAGRDQKFIADWKTDERDCVEMREARPWSYETDYFGLASICYCLLFGKYIATEAVHTEAGQRYKIDAPLKRYWQTELWSKLFDILLNPRSLRSEGTLPVTDELAAIRGEFEAWLEDNCQKNGKLLKQMLKRIELRTIESRRM